MSDGAVAAIPSHPSPIAWRQLRAAAIFLAFTGVYFVGGKVGLTLAQVHPSATALWPGTGIAIAGLLLFGRAYWPAVLLGSFAVNVTTTGDPFTSALIAAGNAAEAFLVAFLVQRFGDGARSFERTPTIFLFIGSVAFAATLSATIGSGSLWVGDLTTAASLPAVWANWWIGNVVGALILTPPLVLWGRLPRAELHPARLAEAGLLFGLVLVLGFAPGWAGGASQESFPTGFLTLPLIVWASFRFTAREAATATLLLALGVAWNTQAGRGAYARGDASEAFLVLAMALGALALVSLVMAALAADRRREALILRTARDQLEGRVSDRTQSLSMAINRLRDEIREREQVEENLRRSRSSLEEAQRLARLGSWEWNLKDNTLSASDELFEVYGMDHKNSPARFDVLVDHIHPDDQSRFREALDAARRTGRPFELDHRILLPNGTARWLRSQGHIEPQPDGLAERMTGTAQDITDRLRLETERLEAAERAKEVDRLHELNDLKTRFMNTAAHELNTPLTPIRVQLHLLRSHMDEGRQAAMRRSLDVLERNIDRMIGLVGDVLEAARLQAARLGIQKESVDVARLVREAVESFQPAAREAGLRLEVSVEGTPLIDADPKRISQVVYNLLSNALKFTPSGGRIRVHAGARAAGAEIRVEDDGIGLTPSQIARLFLPFSQVHDGAVTSRPGTGLGLYISRGIADLHGGTIRAESRGPGKGTTFVLTLPSLEPRTPLASPLTTA